MEGYVDLLIEADGGLIVVDYKTDSVTAATVDDKVAFYELQAASYAVALQVVTGTAVSECRFVFCRPGGPIERTVVDLPAAMEKLECRLKARQPPIA